MKFYITQLILIFRMTNNYLKFYHTILLVILASLVISNVNCKTKPKYASRYCGDDFVKVWKAACLFKKKHNTLFKRELYGKKEIFLNFQWILKDFFIRNIFISNTTNITLKSYLVRTKKILILLSDRRENEINPGFM